MIGADEISHRLQIAYVFLVKLCLTYLGNVSAPLPIPPPPLRKKKEKTQKEDTEGGGGQPSACPFRSR